ncbi:MAG: alpha-glucan family phosphorylase [Acidobacteriota bacterium]|jgi:starch phosphorylase|nr:alpha-glucan family phosphorylase [Acidobacteriota bacterium]
MKPVQTFTIIPRLPAALDRLRDLAYNVHWAWDSETIELFRRLDPNLWETTGHNPVRILGSLSQTRLEDAATDESFMNHFGRVLASFDKYMENKGSWFQKAHAGASPVIAYFSAEFGLTECLSIFAGGLGMLAGDHLKSASDLGLPLVGVGLLYQQGYFRQYLNPAGWQQEAYEDNDFHTLPTSVVYGADGAPLRVEVPMPGRKTLAQVWLVKVGRVSLYLLDTNLPENSDRDRDLTDQLYGGNLEYRLQQEILLGIGGCKALEALGVRPTVYHMNEGHSAFLSLELTRRLMGECKLAFEEARTLASSALVFTTHTPVAAGHDYFPPDLMYGYFKDYAAALGLTFDDFMALGRKNRHDKGESFCMTILALRMAAYSNGVSRLHGEVSRRLWKDLWPEVPEDEIPISHITNGVHFQSWVSREMDILYERYLGPHWREQSGDRSAWDYTGAIAEESLWRTHERRRERLVIFTRRQLHAQLARRGASKAEIEAAKSVLDPEILTIGFARRFATYKRGTLLLRDTERLCAILNNHERPVQVIFAGKAHPHDDAGKELIRQIASLARDPRFRQRLVFLENYDMSVARYLVQGVDVWLNTPLRPNEASGTSGMKALANGVLNLSTLDGWWDEAYRSWDPDGEEAKVGWAIGNGESYADTGYQDQVEAAALYDILERDVIPVFYDRRSDGLPYRWISLMKSSIGNLCRFFNTHRMVREYTDRFYLNADAGNRSLAAGGGARAAALATALERIHDAWAGVEVGIVTEKEGPELLSGDAMRFQALVRTGGLSREDLRVELYSGRLDADGEIENPAIVPMTPVGERDGGYVYETVTTPDRGNGLHGYTVRVLPHHPDLADKFAPRLIRWAK